MNSLQQTKKVTKSDLFQCGFCENPANMTTTYSEHSQQLKRSKLQEKICMAAFLMSNIFS